MNRNMTNFSITIEQDKDNSDPRIDHHYYLNITVAIDKNNAPNKIGFQYHPKDSIMLKKFMSVSKFVQ